jgi:hypothetical protein
MQSKVCVFVYSSVDNKREVAKAEPTGFIWNPDITVHHRLQGAPELIEIRPASK